MFSPRISVEEGPAGEPAADGQVGDHPKNGEFSEAERQNAF